MSDHKICPDIKIFCNMDHVLMRSKDRQSDIAKKMNHKITTEVQL